MPRPRGRPHGPRARVAADRLPVLTVVAYDIADDRRRGRLAALLQDYGVRVQFSVFECELSRDRFEEMCRAAGEIVEPGLDRIAYYRLCGRCERAHDSAGDRRSVILV